MTIDRRGEVSFEYPILHRAPTEEMTMGTIKKLMRKAKKATRKRRAAQVSKEAIKAAAIAAAIAAANVVIRRMLKGKRV